MRRELKSMVDDIGSIALEFSPLGKEREINTNNFAYQGGRIKREELRSKTLRGLSSTVMTSSGDMGVSTDNAKFQYTEWITNPLEDHIQSSDSITRTIDFSIYDEGDIEALTVADMKLPFLFYLKIIQPTQRHYCTYFNNYTQNYSDAGMKMVLKRVVDDGTGLIICSSNHLSEFAALKNAPAEHIDVLTKSNYDVLTKIGSLSDYNYLQSPSTHIYNIYYS